MITKDVGREKSLQALGNAYMKVRDGKAGCVLITLENEEMQISQSNLTIREAAMLMSTAMHLLLDEFTQTLEDIRKGKI
jgi:hypothetical protein